MDSKIIQLIDELEEYIDSCRPQFMSSTNIIVNKERMDELLRELRMRTPDEIKRYQNLISKKEEILDGAKAKASAIEEDAKARADKMLNEATIQTNELISEHEIMQQAYEQANQVIGDAVEKAKEILDKATLEANEVKQAAVQYMDDQLIRLDEIIISASQNVSSFYDEFGKLHDQITANIQELRGTEETDEEVMEEVADYAQNSETE